MTLISYVFLGLINLDCTYAGADYWYHLLFMKSFAEDLWHPDNPFFSPGFPCYLHSPYHLVWGAVLRGLDVNPVYITPLIGIVNIGLFLIAVRLFSERVIGDTRYAFVFLLVLLFFWVKPWSFSGFYNFGLLPLTAVYPYWCAFPLALIGLGVATRRNIASRVLIALLVGLTFLIHPITGSFLIVGLLITAFADFMRSRQLSALYSFVPILLGLALALCWPYYSVLSFILFSGKSLAADFRMFYDRVYLRFFPGLLGVAYLVVSLRHRILDLASAGFTAYLVILLVNYVFLHNVAIARQVVFLAFFLQLCTVMYLHWAREHPSRPLFVLAFAAMLIPASLLEARASLQHIGLARDLHEGTPIGYHTNIRLLKDYERTFKGFLGPNDRVWCRVNDSHMLPLFVGCKVITVWQWPTTKEVPPEFFSQRIADEEEFFSDSTTADRRLAILQKYQATHVFVGGDDARFLGGLELFLRFEARNEDRQLYALVSG